MNIFYDSARIASKLFACYMYRQCKQKPSNHWNWIIIFSSSNICLWNLVLWMCSDVCNPRPFRSPSWSFAGWGAGEMTPPAPVAVILCRSPRKLFIFIIEKCIYRITAHLNVYSFYRIWKCVAWFGFEVLPRSFRQMKQAIAYWLSKNQIANQRMKDQPLKPASCLGRLESCTTFKQLGILLCSWSANYAEAVVPPTNNGPTSCNVETLDFSSVMFETELALCVAVNTFKSKCNDDNVDRILWLIYWDSHIHRCAGCMVPSPSQRAMRSVLRSVLPF